MTQFDTVSNHDFDSGGGDSSSPKTQPASPGPPGDHSQHAAKPLGNTFAAVESKETESSPSLRHELRIDAFDKSFDTARKRTTFAVTPPPLLAPPSFSLPALSTATATTSEDLDALVRQMISGNRVVNGKLRCALHWPLKDCAESDLGSEVALDSYLTVTGTATSACATTCGQWISQTWGSVGLSVLQAVEMALLQKSVPFRHTGVEFYVHPGVGCTAYCNLDILGTEGLVASVQTLAWMATTFRVPNQDGLRYSSFCGRVGLTGIDISLEPLIEILPDTSISCWHSLLGNTVVAVGFRGSEGEPGLELPFALMLELTGMMYSSGAQVPDMNSGIFFTGVHSVLYPTAELGGIVMWHYEASHEVLTPPSSYAALSLSALQAVGMKHILGYTPKVQISLGTQARAHQYGLMMASSASRERDGWSVILDSITPQLGFSGSGVSFPFKIQRRKGQQLAPAAKPKYDQIVQSTADKPVILLDTDRSKEIAWLVPQLSVILDLVISQLHREQLWNTLSDTDRASLYAEPHWNGGAAAKAVLDNHKTANIVIRTSADDGGVVAIKDMVVQVFVAMTRRKQHDMLHEASSGLTGWDLIELTDPLAWSQRLEMDVRQDGLNNSTPTWLPFAKELPAFFCDRLGEVMRSAVPLCKELSTNRKHLVAGVHLLCKESDICARCGAYHFGTNKNLMWKLAPDHPFVHCDGGRTCGTHVQRNFQDGLQMMLPASDHQYLRPEFPGPVMLQEGAVVFGPKHLKTKRTKDVRQIGILEAPSLAISSTSSSTRWL